MAETNTFKQFNVSIDILSRSARIIICQLLNPIKYIPTKENLARDWTGLADLLRFSCEDVAYFRSTGNPTNTVLQKWGSYEDSTIEKLLYCFQKLDRFDIIEDIFDIIFTDVSSHEGKITSNVDTSVFITNKDYGCYRSGQPMMQYHASILYANEDIDFAGMLVRKLESEGNFNIFVPERDLLAGIIEHSATMQIIASRCNKLITILSPAFLKCSVNQHFLSFAQSIGIDQRVRKIVPIVYKDCDVPAELRHLHKLAYNKSGDLYNYFQKLKDALETPVRRTNALAPLPTPVGPYSGYTERKESTTPLVELGTQNPSRPAKKKKKHWWSGLKMKKSSVPS